MSGQPTSVPLTQGERKFDIGEPIIELRNVTIIADDGHKVLDDVSLSLFEGEILGLVFAHGTGKTTLLRVASGFFPPSSGEVLWRGRDIRTLGFDEQLEFQWRTGFVFQNGGLLVNTRIEDNIALPLRYQAKLDEEEIAKRVAQALEQVGMADRAQRFPFELTIGRQKLATLARALVRDPEVIFFDNFTVGAEAVIWQSLTRLVRWLRVNKRMSFLLVMGSDPASFAIADRLCIIEDGRIQATGTQSTLRASTDQRISRVFRTIDFSDESGG